MLLANTLLFASIATLPFGAPRFGQALPTEPSLAESLQPNYASRLASPYKDSDTRPSLVHMWSSFPVRVAVLEDGDLYSEAAYQAVCGACDRWATATNAVPGGGVSFTYEHSVCPKDAQIVIRLARYYELDYQATTLADESKLLIAVEVTGKNGRWIPQPALVRKVTHEMGHALGIGGHSPDAGDIMSSEPASGQISLADVNTLRIAYGGLFRLPEPPKRL